MSAFDIDDFPLGPALPVKFGTSRGATVRRLEHEVLDYLMTLAAQREQSTPQGQSPPPDNAHPG